MRDYLKRLFQYVAWADQRGLDAVEQSGASQAEALPLLAHVLAAEHLWLCRLLGKQARYSVWPELDLDECRALATENADGFQRLLGQLSDSQLSAMISYRTTDGQDRSSTAIDILTQVATHGPYHRGQIAKSIARHGGTPRNTDYITFAREVP
jgi:uncharacterized damage-inducible protein DinB